MANDFFANIAGTDISGKREQMYDPEPIKLDKRVCTLNQEDLLPFPITKKMSTKKELYAALETAKAHYRPFLQNKAPTVESTCKRRSIRHFTVDGEHEVTVPEYGGPIGNVKKTYETVFVIDRIQNDKVYFIRFLGADYRAFVYINDTCVGTHEGFFSPFEFDITNVLHDGENKLRIELFNDYIWMGNNACGKEHIQGEKLYAATGLGWDDAAEGWHHCPAGMGIYNHVYIEERNPVHIHDIFVRPLCRENTAEVWVEVNNISYETIPLKLRVSLYGQNFEETVFENLEYEPLSNRKKLPLDLKHGINLYKVPIQIKSPKIWEPDTPYLYQIQASVIVNGAIADRRGRQFGMREFYQDLENNPKGMYYLNGKKIKLRGANTMGFEQQDVLNNDMEQLLNDLLLAKLCHMNYLRLTQRPVQDEIYDLCDKLGLMTQTDLPLFAAVRRPSFCEGIRQAEEMERMVRAHPCNIQISYLNEPHADGFHHPHRHLVREESEAFFKACDIAVRLNNPDRVIKHIEGDFDPPNTTLPDNHLYPFWYNGQGMDIGKMNKGYWYHVKPNWYCGCGEYGIEGLDFVDMMKRRYPKEWIREPFDPNRIVNAQTGELHAAFYDRQDDMESWVKESQAFQAFGTKFMTEALRRNPLIVSSAIHLLIDAWPAGWMKAIMDCERTPKPAFFAYRNAIRPIMLSLRTDRYTYYAGETVSIEAYICNDTALESDRLQVRYELYRGDCLIMSQCCNAKTTACGIDYVSNCEFAIDKVCDREAFKLVAVLMDEHKTEIDHNSMEIEIFADIEVPKNDRVILIDRLPLGAHEIAGETVTVKKCNGKPVHFVSRKTAHPAVAEFLPKDFSYWYDKEQDMITPLSEHCFFAKGFTPILISCGQEAEAPAMVCGVKSYQNKLYVICQVDLRCENPVAKRFKKAIYSLLIK